MTERNTKLNICIILRSVVSGGISTFLKVVYVDLIMCMCVCMYARVCMCVCVYLCVQFTTS